jgi:hypothetical protein
MKTTDKERLLNDVLEDERYRAFRSGMRSDILRELQHGRRKNTWARGALALAACVPVACAVYLWFAHEKASSTVGGSSVAIVHSRPLRGEEVVRTKDFEQTSADVLVVKTANAEIEVVKSRNATEEVSDQQLLELFKGQPVALVTVSPHERQLILLKEEQ